MGVSKKKHLNNCGSLGKINLTEIDQSDSLLSMDLREQMKKFQKGTAGSLAASGSKR